MKKAINIVLLALFAGLAISGTKLILSYFDSNETEKKASIDSIKNNHGTYFEYFSNSKIKRISNYKNGKKANWWLFYDQSGKIIHKCQLHDGIKNGYCLKYKNEKLASAEKYKNGQKIKEWFSFRSFKKENKLSDLR